MNVMVNKRAMRFADRGLLSHMGKGSGECPDFLLMTA